MLSFTRLLPLLLTLSEPDGGRPACPLELLEISPPADLHLPIQERLAPSAVDFRCTDGPDGRLWLARELGVAHEAQPVAPAPRNYPQIARGALVGAVEWRRPWRDFRGEAVAPGVYTLRYAVQPMMKDHLGVSESADFLVLTPAAVDREVTRSQASTVALGRVTSADGHPAILQLAPGDETAGAPSVVGRAGRLVLVAPLGDRRLGLVIEGSARSP